MSQPKIGIYAPDPEGHRFKYVQYLISHVPIQESSLILFTTRKGYNHSNYKLHLEPIQHRFSTIIINENEFTDEATCSKEHATDLIIVPDGDEFAWRRAWRRAWQGHGQVTALAMRTEGQGASAMRRSIGSTVKKALLGVANCRANVRVLKLHSSLWNWRTNENGVPDPVSYEPDMESLERLVPPHVLKARSRWIGVVGALTPRKNIELVLEAASHIGNNDYGVLLAGRLDATVKDATEKAAEVLRQQGVPVIFLDQILTDNQLDAVLKHLHCVVLAHSNEGPSGILGKAVLAGTYVVAAGAHSLRRDCMNLSTAARWTPLDRAAITTSLSDVLRLPPPPSKSLETVNIFAERLLAHTLRDSKSC